MSSKPSGGFLVLVVLILGMALATCEKRAQGGGDSGEARTQVSTRAEPPLQTVAELLAIWWVESQRPGVHLVGVSRSLNKGEEKWLDGRLCLIL